MILPILTVSKASKKAKIKKLKKKMLTKKKDKTSSIKPIDVFTGFNQSVKTNIKQKYQGVKGTYLWVNNINGKSYVGKSINLHQRISKYFSASYLEANKSKMAICGAIAKYGINNFSLYILEIIDLDTTREYLSERENYWYQLINPSYNLQSIIQPFTGSNHYRFGSKLSDEIKSKISQTLKGRVMSDSEKANRRLGARKKPVYCYDSETGKFLMEFTGLRPMARDLNIKSMNNIKYYLNKDKVFSCTIDNVNYKLLLKSSKIFINNNNN